MIYTLVDKGQDFFFFHFFFVNIASSMVRGIDFHYINLYHPGFTNFRKSLNIHNNVYVIK